MAKGISNTSRTLRYIRAQGWSANIVECYNFYSKQRKDLFGIIDIVALTDKGITGIQSTGQNFAEHDRKILQSPEALEWIEAGGHLMLIGWRKVKLRYGAKALRWAPRIKEYEIKDFK